MRTVPHAGSEAEAPGIYIRITLTESVRSARSMPDIWNSTGRTDRSCNGDYMTNPPPITDPERERFIPGLTTHRQIYKIIANKGKLSERVGRKVVSLKV